MAVAVSTLRVLPHAWNLITGTVDRWGIKRITPRAKKVSWNLWGEAGTLLPSSIFGMARRGRPNERSSETTECPQARHQTDLGSQPYPSGRGRSPLVSSPRAPHGNDSRHQWRLHALKSSRGVRNETSEVEAPRHHAPSSSSSHLAGAQNGLAIHTQDRT